MTHSFRYTHTTTFTIVYQEANETDFYNFKNRAEGGRRYGYKASVVKAANPDGSTAFRTEFQTTLNGSRYQSSKHGNWVATEAEARAALAKTIAGAQKRYAKLAQDPASKIEYRPS